MAKPSTGTMEVSVAMNVNGVRWRIRAPIESLSTSKVLVRLLSSGRGSAECRNILQQDSPRRLNTPRLRSRQERRKLKRFRSGDHGEKPHAGRPHHSRC